MKIALGSDHGGYLLKEDIKEFLKEEKYTYHDFGCHSLDSVDYPDYALPVAQSVVSGEYDLGILICGTGIGMSVAANKVPGIRAALVSDLYTARVTREHNNSNILVMGGRVVGPGLAREMVKAWLEASFEGGRHNNRLEKISQIETLCKTE